ncbi:ABC transporter permease [Bacillaceae bacterium Marseille-Q3522]|nr:ABC transporter permease [Bacillaceae bacterium Marseille-Q3522]
MSSLRICINRIKQDLLYQHKILKIVFDWTVLLYLVLPGCVIAFFIYRSWWQELPAWSEYFSLPLLGMIAYLLSWLSNNRTFVKEADGVFLLKHKEKFVNLKKWAFIYSLFYASLKIIFLVIVTLPFLQRLFSYSIVEILAFAFFYIGLTYLILACKTMLQVRVKGWKEKVITTAIFIGLFMCNSFLFSPYLFKPVFSICSALVFVGISLLLILPIVVSTKYFQAEVTKENEERMRFISMIFRASPDLEKPKIIKRNKPFLFRRSKRLFKKRTAENAFLELFIKIIIRNLTYLSGYFRLIGVTGTAIILIPPTVLKIGVAGFFAFFIFDWMANVWNKIILSHPLSKKYEDSDAFYRGRRKMQLSFCIPPIMFIMIVLMASTYLG